MAYAKRKLANRAALKRALILARVQTVTLYWALALGALLGGLVTVELIKVLVARTLA